MKLTRIRIQEARDTVEYATENAAVESLRVLAAKHGLPVLDALRIMANESVDSITLTKDRPMVHLYVRKTGDSTYFHIKEGGRSIRFELPITQIGLLSHDLSAER
jgi:hypothetical protein